MLKIRMFPLAAVLLLAAASSGCAADPNWSWRQAPRPAGPVAMPVARAPATHVKLLDADKGGPRRKLPKGPPTYKYGAKFEPPDGRILHGMGNWIEGNRNYLAVLGEPALEPAASTYFLAIGDWLRPWEGQVERMRRAVETEAAMGRMLHVGIELWGMDLDTGKQVPVDVIIARGSKFDGHVRDVARVLAESGTPAFVRIGSEFSGPWTGYSPLEYPKAYRKVVEIFREEHADNVAFVWCWEANCPGDFDVREQGQWRWYPGDDVVDWFGVDLYNHAAFASPTGRGAGTLQRKNTLHFLDMAEQHGKPVLIGESGAVTVEITADEQDGRRDWAAWFEPYFQFMADHPGIKAFFYDNSDWVNFKQEGTNDWKDGDISHNEFIAARYAQEMRDPVYLHKSELHLLKDWPTDKRPEPPVPATPVVPEQELRTVYAPPQGKRP